MSDIKYRFGYNEEGKIVSIDELNQSNKHDKTIRCLSCDCILTPKIGKVRVPHFSHKPNVNCSNESYLHKLSKRILIQKFYESPEFIIRLRKKYDCVESQVCRYNSENCLRVKNVEFNLKQFYDTCQEEQTVEDFRSDILISDSTGRYKDPILIEIYCTHKSSSHKLNSGLRIIEIKVESEDDVMRLLDYDLEENEKVKFIGFNRESKESHTIGKPILSRFVLYQSGEVDIIDSISCMDRNIKHDHTSLLELNIIPFGWERWRTVLEWGMIKSWDLGYKFKNCLLCKHHELFNYDQPILCRLNISKHTPFHPKQTDCLQCQYYEVDYRHIRMIRESMKYDYNSIIIVGED